jgi:serine protease DegS
MGAGVAVSPDHILTAHYLVLGASHVQVSGIDGRTQSTAGIALDHDSGLALLTVERPDLEPMAISSTRPRPGLPVFLLTCTSERERFGATGHVSSVEPFEAFWEYMLDEAILTTMKNDGLAGGPLLDEQARLLGIVSLRLDSVGRYSLAIPAELFTRRRALLEADGPMPAKERRAWIGLYSQAPDETVSVTGLVSGGPADEAGLLEGDLVLSVDGETVKTLRELYRALRRKTPGQTVGLKVLRDESIHVLEIVAGDRYEFYK